MINMWFVTCNGILNGLLFPLFAFNAEILISEGEIDIKTDLSMY